MSCPKKEVTSMTITAGEACDGFRPYSWPSGGH
jgi:hypothetical protein